MRDSFGYANEIEKSSRDNSKVTMNVELKNALTKKRLMVWGYTNSEYLYMLKDGELTLKYKTYTIKSQDKSLEA